jgi:hypothetical protein
VSSKMFVLPQSEQHATSHIDLHLHLRVVCCVRGYISY